VKGQVLGDGAPNRPRGLVQARRDRQPAHARLPEEVAELVLGLRKHTFRPARSQFVAEPAPLVDRVAQRIYVGLRPAGQARRLVDDRVAVRVRRAGRRHREAEKPDESESRQ